MLAPLLPYVYRPCCTLARVLRNRAVFSSIQLTVASQKRELLMEDDDGPATERQSSFGVAKLQEAVGGGEQRHS